MPEETDSLIRLPVSEPKNDEPMRTLVLSSKDGITALYAVDRKLILTYIFVKNRGWDMVKARKWISEHKQ